MPLARIRAIAFSTEFRSTPRVKGPYAHVVLAGGGRIGLLQPRLEESADGQQFWPASQSSAARCCGCRWPRSGPSTFARAGLLSLRFAGQVSKHALLESRLAARQGSQRLGSTIASGADTFDKGLGMHSQSKRLISWRASTAGLKRPWASMNVRGGWDRFASEYCSMARNAVPRINPVARHLPRWSAAIAIQR